MEIYGINSLVEDTRQELTSMVNDKLQKGLPVSVLGLILENMLFEVKNGIKETLKKEKEQHDYEEEAREEQVPWVDEIQSKVVAEEAVVTVE